jgi:excisionase family DNA binding protein
MLNEFPALLTVNEVARALRVHTVTVRRMIDRGDLRAVRACSAVRIPRAELDRLLAVAVASNPTAAASSR